MIPATKNAAAVALTWFALAPLACTPQPAHENGTPSRPVPSSSPSPSTGSLSTEQLGPLSSPNPDSLAWSTSAHWLAYSSYDGEVWIGRPERDHGVGEGISVPGSPSYLFPVWSPTSQLLVVYGHWGVSSTGPGESGTYTGLWLTSVSPDGSTSTAMIVPPTKASSRPGADGWIHAASWSPDGDRVAYDHEGEVWIYDVLSGKASQLTSISDNPIRRPNRPRGMSFIAADDVLWSPAGDWIALGLSCNCPSPWSGVAAIRQGGQSLSLISDGARLASWSPDGLRLGFTNVTGDWAPGTTYDQYAADPIAGDIVNLTRSNPSYDPRLTPPVPFVHATYTTSSLQWSSDGRYLYQTGSYAASDQPSELGFVIRSDPDTTVVDMMGDTETSYVFPRWLDSAEYAYFQAEPKKDDRTFHLRRAMIGSAAVADLDLDVVAAAWSPDGSSVAVVAADPQTGWRVQTLSIR